MKKALFLFTIIALFSCTKEKENSIRGRWKVVESYTDVAPYVIPLSNTRGYIEFKANGEFATDNSNTYAPYNAFKDYDRYSIVSNEMLKLYSTNRSDTVTVLYYFHDGLILTSGWIGNRFTR
jgi:hypothetical protein